MKQTPSLTWFEKRSVMLFASLSVAAAGQTFAPSASTRADTAARAQSAMVKQVAPHGLRTVGHRKAG